MDEKQDGKGLGWWPWVALALLGLYPLSFGPVGLIAQKLNAGDPAAVLNWPIYRPLIAVMRGIGLDGLLMRYLYLFTLGL